MAFKTNIPNPLCRTAEMTETQWEFEAPRFFDFSRVHEEQFDEYDYFSIDHDKIYSTQLQNNVSQHEESVTQEDAVGCHIDTQLNKLNLRNDTAEQRNDNECNSPHQESGRVRFVNVVTIARKRLSMSVDRGQRKLAKQMATRVGPARRALYTVAASPILNQSAQHCLAHGEDDLQHHEQDSNAAAGLCDATAENIVDELMEGNAQMVEAEKIACKAAVPFAGIPFLRTNASRTCVKPFSFEERNKRMLALKQEKIRQAVEAEKKLREFHARPFPEIIYSSVPARSMYAHPTAGGVQRSIKIKTESSHMKMPCFDRDKTNAENNPPTFRARPATVLRKQPFIPEKPAKTVASSCGLSLKTEDRAAHRVEWEKSKKEREQQAAEKKREQECREREANEAEMKRLRQLTVHRARPVPHFIRQRKPAIE